MNWIAIWIDAKTGRVRSGWRVAIFLVLTLVIATVALSIMVSLAPRLGVDPAQMPFMHPERHQDDLTFTLIYSLATIIGATAAAVMALRYFDHLPSHTLGLGVGGRRIGALAIGFLGAVGLIGLLLALAAATGIVAWRVQAPSSGMLVHLLLAAGALLIMALWFEVLFHGYIFQTLLRGIGMPVTLLLMTIVSVPYTASITPLSITNLALEGLLFGLLYLRAGHLWLPVGVSAGWNFGLLLCHLRISGKVPPLETPIVATLSGHPLLTGGDFGLEGSVLASAVLLLAIAAVVYAPFGLPLTSRWWAWDDLSTPATPLPAWDFTVDTRHYQWKLLPREPAE